MRVVELNKFEESVVLHFKTTDTRINAYTLASSLVAIADAAKAANTSINPGFEIEVVVDAIGEGSFRAKITALYKTSKNIFSNQVLAGVVIGVLANYIYERTLAVEDGVNVQINTDEVIIERGDEKIIVPRKVYEATRTAEENPQFKEAINKTLKAIENDSEIEAFAFVEKMDSPPPEIEIPREAIVNATVELQAEEPFRTVEEVVNLQIIKAILEESRRKWEFMWRGIKISAPIASKKFYIEFFAHDITIAPGDVLEVKLLIKQELDTKTGIYSNKSYEVAEVYKHIPRVRQMNMNSTTLAKGS